MNGIEVKKRLAEIAQEVDELPDRGEIPVDHAKKITTEMLNILTDYMRTKDINHKSTETLLESREQLHVQNEKLRRQNRELSFIAAEALQQAYGRNISGNA